MAVVNTNFAPSPNLITTMTFDELQHTLNKSVIYLGAGSSLGYCIANYCLLRHATVFALATGLLCSLHPICKWVIALVEEYKRLKAQENENIS